jgi:plastocyanin
MRYEILFLGLVVVAAGCVHATGSAESSPENETSTPSEPADYSDTRTIYFTGSEFEPAELVVEQGDTVTWVSNSSTSMWVASDQHPTHTEYEGSTLREHCQNGDQTSQAFDQCSQGEEFSFTFEKTGEWSYHNHQPFASGGTITVR